MKIVVLGIAMILAFSSTGFGYLIGTKFGLTISSFCFITKTG